MGYEIGGALGFLLLIVNIWVIIKIASSRSKTVSKIAWIAAVLLLPVIGLIIWLLAGPKE